MTETNWQTSLQQDGANITEGVIAHFGDAADELQSTASGNTLCDLSHLGLLSLSGDDASTFLQGQVTNDVRQLDGSLAHYSGYCSPKGRMLALFFAFSFQDQFYLQFSQPLLAPIMKRLKMYVMRAKVDVQDESNNWVRLGVNGPNATNIVNQIMGDAPKADYAFSTTALGAIIKLPSIEGHSRYEVLVDTSQAHATWSALKALCTPVGKPCWDWLEIQTGSPEVVEKTQGQFVPQMLNLDRLNGINFKKGCYTGQEIVARTHYLGKVKRRTYLASISLATLDILPNAGDKVFDAMSSEVGQIVKAAPNLTGGFDALIELRVEAKQTGGITWESNAVKFGNLPYQLEDAE